MAKYDYKCSCGEEIIIEKPMKEASRAEYCDKCNNELQRVFNATPNQWKCGGAFINS